MMLWSGQLVSWPVALLETLLENTMQITGCSIEVPLKEGEGAAVYFVALSVPFLWDTQTSGGRRPFP